jgi:Na+/H+ antiporter NhaD/arsenite permease-like protein
VLGSNIGGTATLIGDPPNIMIGAHTGLSFGAFIVHLAPVSAVMLAVMVPLVHLMFRRQLRIDPERRRSVLELDAAEPLRRGRHLRRSMVVLGGTIALFFLHSPLGLGVTTVALTGALATMAVSGASADRLLRRVDWATLFFFAGLFVMVHALAAHGVLDRVAEGIADAAGGDRDATLMLIVWGAAVGSALVDNIPFTAAMLPVVEQLAGAEDDAHWWALALGACFGGNATLVAAAANVAAAGAAERRGHGIGFWTFTRAGAPVTLISLAIASAYVLLVIA